MKLRRSKAIAIILLTCMGIFQPVNADIGIVRKYVPDASLVGKSRMKFLVWKAYDASLYAPKGQLSPDQPFSLSLTYLRKFSGVDIAKRSIKEIREQGSHNEVKLIRWEDQLMDIFPDVEKNETITGIKDRNYHAHFYKNGSYIASIEDPLFTKSFFDIWLSEKTSAPKFRARLLGGGN